MMMKNLIICGLAIAPLLIEAMPSKTDLDAVAPVVADLMKPEQDALKAGKKTKSEVADAAIGLVAQADSEAAKLLLLKGAFGLYVRDGQYEKALETLKTIRSEVPDITPQYLAGVIEPPLGRVSRKKCPGLYQILDETKTLARYQDELKKIEAQAKKRPADAALKTQLAEHYAILGDWTKALDAFEKGGDAKAAGVAKDEKAGAADAKAIADFWWEYPENKGKPVEKAFKQHAAKLYADALASGKLAGLNKVQVERRIKEAEALGEAVAQPLAESGGKKIYCVIDLSGGPNATRYPVSYLNDVPKGGWTDEYKTTKLVLRKIEPGSFEYLPGKKFTLTKPFYIGIFEVTQKQYELVAGECPAKFRGDMRPVESVSYEMIRGKEKGLTWPQSDAVDGGSFVSRVRDRASLRVDVPTEVQWEYACRAGTTSKFNNGGDTKEDMWQVGCCAGNGGKRQKHVKVGSYLQNQWGLYDMHGNVLEWCLDRGSCDNAGEARGWDHDNVGGMLDPLGASTGNAFYARGGNFWNRAGDCESSRRHIRQPDARNDGCGFRLAIQPPFVPPKK